VRGPLWRVWWVGIEAQYSNAINQGIETNKTTERLKEDLYRTLRYISDGSEAVTQMPSTSSLAPPATPPNHRSEKNTTIHS